MRGLQLTVRARLAALALFTLASAAVIGVTGYWGVGRVDRAMDDVTTALALETGRAQADIMHDALRADVLAALVAGQGNDAEARKQVVTEARDHTKRLRQALVDLRAAITSPALRQALDAVERAVEPYVAQAEAQVLLATSDPAAGRAKMAAFVASFEAVARDMDRMAALIAEEAATSRTGGDAAVVATKWTVVVTVLVAAALMGVCTLLVARSILCPLASTVDLLRDIAEGEGDLTRRLDASRRDEIGELARWFNVLMDKLHDILSQVRDAATQAATASRELSSATEQLSSGTQEQAASLEETAASLEEITATVKQNADNAHQANQLASASREVAEKGGGIVTEAVGSMADINQSSRKIADIISTIDEIAFQTNLLALNAAVEAARAGEQGRGFAVVAAEVRNLAQRSATAAKEIKTLIQDSVTKVDRGSEQVNRSGAALQEIVASVKRVTDIVAEIAAASGEQSSGIEQVNKAVTQMDTVVQTNAAQSEELASTAQAMAVSAAQLQGLVGRFKFATVSGAAPAHPPAAAASPRPATAPREATSAVVTRRHAVRVRNAPVMAVAAATERGNGSGHSRDGGFEEF